MVSVKRVEQTAVADRPITLGWPQTTPAGAKPASALGVDRVERQIPQTTRPVHLIFVSDLHSNDGATAKFVAQANARKPDLIIDGGDRVHEGLEVEFIRSEKALAGLEPAFYEVEGNHDAKPKGPFRAPKPTPPTFQSFDKGQVHFILLDNSSETLSEAQLTQLEADLKANQGKTTIVALHVPALLKDEPAMIRMANKLPIGMASPVMQGDGVIDRFTGLMSKYHVAAVLAGHTHYPDYVEKDGVKYFVVSAAGGMTPGMGIAHEYLDIHVQGKVVEVTRIPLDSAPTNPVSYAYRILKFTADLNQVNHDEAGWVYNPRASVQLRPGLRFTTTDHGTSLATSATVSAESARKQNGKGAFTADVSVAAGRDELSADLMAGYKYAPVGGYTTNLYVAGSVGVNGGYIANQASAGVGARGGLGFEHKHLTLEVGHEIATNRRMSYAAVGYRF